MAEHEIVLEVTVKIVTTDEGEAGIDRWVGLTPEQGREDGIRPDMTKQQLLVDLARSAVLYGRQDANMDGYADLDRDAFHLYTIDASEL